MTDDLRRRLEALGEIEPPQLGDDRIDAMGERVMAATTERSPVGGRRRTIALGIAAVLVALLVAGVVLATTKGADDLVLELADGVTLELPDGGPERGAAGDALPDGTVITVDDGGLARVDGRRVGPGRYLVVGGELVRLDGGTATTTTTTTTTTTVKPTRTTAGGDEPNGRPDAVVPPGRTTAVPSRDPAVRPPTDGTRPSDPTTTRPTTPPPTTIADRPTTTRPATSTTTPPDRTTTTIQRTTTTPPRDRPTTTPPTTVGDRPPSDGS